MSAFQKMRADVVTALTDQGLTVGAQIQFESLEIVAGHLAHDDPALSPIYIDDLGRLWKEWSHGGGHKLECVLDLRSLSPV